jgi:hypothetical protein
VSDNRKSSNKESVHETKVGNEAKLEYVVYAHLWKSPLNARKGNTDLIDEFVNAVT